MFLPPFQGLDQSDTSPGVALVSLASPLAIVYRAFSALEEKPKLKLQTSEFRERSL
jgi:hypothetical protein